VTDHSHIETEKEKTKMSREEALEALDRAKTREEMLAVIEAYGGLPVEVFRGWQRLLPLPSLFGP
jgi:hypothetical protein